MSQPYRAFRKAFFFTNKNLLLMRCEIRADIDFMVRVE